MNNIRDALLRDIQAMVLCHAPSGNEIEIDRWLQNRWQALGLHPEQDAAGNLIAKIEAADPAAPTVAISAHKDEIGMIVKRVDDDGRIHIRRLGGSFPWVYGEGVVDLLGDRETVSGILSFGSRHVSHESPQHCFQNEQPLKWENVWVETKLSSRALSQAGVRPGTRVVIGRHRKRPFLLGQDHIASYALDNRASLAILTLLAEHLKQPRFNVLLVATANEEVGAIGAQSFTFRQRPDVLIALEICPKSPEYPIDREDAPVLLSQDGYGVYDDSLNAELAKAATKVRIEVQYAVLAGFGSDGSIAMKNGHVPRAACLAFPTDNTHGFEIAHLGALEGCMLTLLSYLERK